MKLTSKLLATAALLTASATAMAHPGHTEGGFTSGLLHPMLGLDHLLAMAAIGFWGVGSIVVDNKNNKTWAGGRNARNELPPGVPAGKGGDLTPVAKVGDYVTQGSYLGHFGYGGSSIVLAFQPEVDGTALTYNFSAIPAGAKEPVPFSVATLTGASVQVNALQQIGVASPDATEV